MNLTESPERMVEGDKRSGLSSLFFSSFLTVKRSLKASVIANYTFRYRYSGSYAKLSTVVCLVPTGQQLLTLIAHNKSRNRRLCLWVKAVSDW